MNAIKKLPAAELTSALCVAESERRQALKLFLTSVGLLTEYQGMLKHRAHGMAPFWNTDLISGTKDALTPEPQHCDRHRRAKEHD
eukprot:27027-Eustigmatos_ZCMA.PRE.1